MNSIAFADLCTIIYILVDIWHLTQWTIANIRQSSSTFVMWRVTRLLSGVKHFLEPT